MSRLTVKVDNVKLLEQDIRYLPKESSMRAFDTLNKLGELEDLEEQGRLIEVKRGRWKRLNSDIYSNIYFCSNCLVYERVKTVMGKPAFDYCPNCGAKMLAELKGTEE